MAYLQITTRCNMSCDHCCFSCGKQGDDMTHETWKKALDFCKNFGHHITIGGGEPTIHRNFREFLLDTIAESEDGMVPFIVTNGSTKHADLLYKLSKAKVINCELSQDEWHDPIDYHIVEKFESINAIRDVSHGGRNGAMPKGRALERMVYEGDLENDQGQYCTCEDLMIDPKGNVKACGCPDAPIIFNLYDDDWSEKWDEMNNASDNCLGQECWHYIKNDVLSLTA